MNITELRRRRNNAVAKAKTARKALPYRNRLSSRAAGARSNIIRRKAANAKRKLASQKKKKRNTANKNRRSA